MLQLYNTLTRKIEPFKPIKKDEVGLYSCGPTVYNYIHLGNLRAYVFVDVLKKYLRYAGFKVKQVMNITDIDDKTIIGSREKNRSLQEYTDFYLDAFLKDSEALKIEKPDITPRATGHIQEMVDLIKKLEKNGYAYKVNNSIYFRINKFKNYGKLARFNKQFLKRDVEKRNIKDEYGKEEMNDFVLWKAWQPDDGDIYWDTVIGRGRPGWHIECSAMSMKYLGETFDIHTGGVDLIFPHHTNEIAQSEAATGKKFVNYWVHNAHLIVNGLKMSKSLNNFYTLRDIQKKRYNPLLLRLILLKTHYRQKLNFTFNSFKEAEAIITKFLDFLINLSFIGNKGNNKLDVDGMILKCKNSFKESMDNDLNISLALATIFNFMNEINRSFKFLNIEQARKIKRYIFEIDSVLGFIEIFYDRYQRKISELISEKSVKELLNKRAEMRENKNYKKADRLREELLNKGIIINDTADGDNIRLVNIL